MSANIFLGQKWRSRRKILTPAFHFKILEEFVETFDRQSTVLIKKLLRFDKNDRVELFPIVALYALDVICGNIKLTKFVSQIY